MFWVKSDSALFFRRAFSASFQDKALNAFAHDCDLKVHQQPRFKASETQMGLHFFPFQIRHAVSRKHLNQQAIIDDEIQGGSALNQVSSIIKTQWFLSLHFQLKTPQLDRETFLIGLAAQAWAKGMMDGHAGTDHQVRKIIGNHKRMIGGNAAG